MAQLAKGAKKIGLTPEMLFRAADEDFAGVIQ